MDNIMDNEFRKNTKKDDFELYRNFHNVEEAQEFVKVLELNDILFLSENTDTIFEKAIVGNGFVPKVTVKILPEDFKKVNSILASQISEINPDELKDHFLNQLDDLELREIINKPDEWSIENVGIAKILLESRGIHISDEEVNKVREDRLNHLRKGEKGNRVWMVCYFLMLVTGLFTTYILLIAGMGMGYYYKYGKSTDQDGNKFFTYDEETRRYGGIILFVGVGLVVMQIILVLMFGMSLYNFNLN